MYAFLFVLNRQVVTAGREFLTLTCLSLLTLCDSQTACHCMIACQSVSGRCQCSADTQPRASKVPSFVNNSKCKHCRHDLFRCILFLCCLPAASTVVHSWNELHFLCSPWALSSRRICRPWPQKLQNNIEQFELPLRLTILYKVSHNYHVINSCQMSFQGTAALSLSLFPESVKVESL